MKKKLLFLVGLLAVMTSAQAADGTLCIANVTNLIPGQTGTLDIVISGSDNTYRDFQFDITLPTGLTYTGYTVGELINGTGEAAYIVTRSDQGGNKSRFTGYTSATNTMKAKNGTLLTISFTVASTVTSSVSGELSLSGISLTNASATSYLLTNVQNVIFGDALVPTDQSGVYVTMGRTFMADKWSTICLPFAMTADQVTAAFGSGVEIGDFNGYTISGNTINVNFTTPTPKAISANHPYILKVASTINSFSVADPVNISYSSPTNNKGTGQDMIGVYAETTLNQYDLYIKDNTFKYAANSTNVKLRPYHAFFRFGDFSPSAGARAVTINYNGNATGIQGVVAPWAGSESIYYLQGRRVETPTNGVFIQNGKKVTKKSVRSNR